MHQTGDQLIKQWIAAVNNTNGPGWVLLIVPLACHHAFHSSVRIRGSEAPQVKGLAWFSCICLSLREHACAWSRWCRVSEGFKNINEPETSQLETTTDRNVTPFEKPVWKGAAGVAEDRILKRSPGAKTAAGCYGLLPCSCTLLKYMFLAPDFEAFKFANFIQGSAAWFLRPSSSERYFPFQAMKVTTNVEIAQNGHFCAPFRVWVVFSSPTPPFPILMARQAEANSAFQTEMC